MLEDLREEYFEHAEFDGKPILITDCRVAKDAVPDGWFKYDLRGSDYDPGKPIAIENYVFVNHAGTVISPTEIPFGEGQDRLFVEDKLNYIGEELSFVGFCDEHGIEYPFDQESYIRMGGM